MLDSTLKFLCPCKVIIFLNLVAHKATYLHIVRFSPYVGQPYISFCHTEVCPSPIKLSGTEKACPVIHTIYIFV